MMTEIELTLTDFSKCNFKDDKDFCHALVKPQVCRPSICFYGLGEMGDNDD